MAVTEVKPGARLRSTVSEAEVVVVRGPQDAVQLRCGGAPMVALDAATEAAAAPGDDGSTLLGKRYVDETSSLELLCTKGGAGALTADGRVLTLKGAKPLPSSD
ncbi:MAG: hypothetical protein JWN08_1480 [Frankiales bacterium]|jgi:hypothetical protein|nr:hypothetical protein [Frankiales bacterium]